MSRKHKFDLSSMVHSGYLKDGETVYFVSDPSMKAVVSKQPNGEYKLKLGAEMITVHACAQKFLGEEPPDHASRWLRTEKGKTLYELWQCECEAEAA